MSKKTPKPNRIVSELTQWEYKSVKEYCNTNGLKLGRWLVSLALKELDRQAEIADEKRLNTRSVEERLQERNSFKPTKVYFCKPDGTAGETTILARNTDKGEAD